MDGSTYDHQESSLDLELLIYPLILCHVVPQLLVETVALGCFDNTRGEDLKREAIRFDRRARQMSGGY